MEKKYNNPAPVVIVRVQRNQELLLVKGLAPKKHYTCVAGYIEAGETAEQACSREVLEETGIHINNIKYHSSQHWPHPNQLMLAFTAEYSSGIIQIDKSELTDAKWFSSTSEMEMPRTDSVAYRMITEFFIK